MIRVIVMSDESGSREEVIFTAADDDAVNFCKPGFTVDIEEEISDMPDCFPLEYTLVRE